MDLYGHGQTCRARLLKAKLFGLKRAVQRAVARGMDPEAPDAGVAPPSCMLTRDSAAIIQSVDDDVRAVLGWAPEDLIGNPSTAFIHPEDQPTAVAAWFDMLADPGSVKVFRGRYRAADGSWRWLEVVNENRLDDPTNPIVVTRLVPVTVHEVTIEEELRARKQLLALLADALPVGIFQFDGERQITFANDRLHALIGRDSCATLAAAFAALAAPYDREFAEAVDGVLAGAGVDCLELHLLGDNEALRVFELSLRPLTASDETVTGAIGCLSDVTERALMRYALEREAAHDPLTQCLNRNAILAHLDLALHTLDESEGVAVLFIDLDGFKATNDDYGHAAGDAVLVEVAHRLTDTLRHRDALGRLGGDEFLVICPAITSLAAAQQLAARVHTALHGDMVVDAHSISIAATIGLAWTATAIPRDLLVSEADHAMYEQKREKQANRSTAA